MKAYKVVTKCHDGERLRWGSCCVYPIVYYRVRKWTERPQGCGPLACFETLDHALRFNVDIPQSAVYQCSIVPSTDTYLWTERQRLFQLPAGTVLADKVKLVKRVQ